MKLVIHIKEIEIKQEKEDASYPEDEKKEIIVKSKRGRKKGSKNLPKTDQLEKSRRKNQNPKKIVLHHPPPMELPEPIQCEICNASYNNNVDFAFHSLSHSDDGKYTCHLCNYRNSSKYHMEMHVRAHEGTTKYKCEICDKAFTISTHALEHKNFHTGEKPFQCEICGKHFMFSWHLASHRRTSHYEILTGKPLVKFDCIECNKHYESASGLRRHNIKKHKSNEIDLSVICEICGKRLSSKEKLKFHLRTHTGYKPHACHVCPKSFSKKDQLIEHIRTHTGEKPYVCKLCGRKRKETIQTNALKQKSRKTSPHPPPLLLEDPLQCDDCTATFNNNVDFAFHSLVHSKDNKYTCHLCNYKNSYKYKIGIHVRTHEGTNKFKCETCGKGFMGQKQAEEHKNFHTGEMPFQCEICGKYFMFSSRLASHRRSYHYEVLTGKPLVKFDCIECKKHYKSAEGLRTHIIKIHKANEIDLTVICEICGKKLANKKRLKFHLRIHTGYKPFACHICPKNFSKKDQLIEHIRTHTGEKPYVCKLCGKGFAQRTPLKTHEKTHNVDRPGNACNLCRFVFKSKIELEYHAKLCYSAQTDCNKT
ncbi:zinc finger protein ZFP2-like [Diorhabda sublineata]|uniref:zinc finger protein ZFP2-like n=1 Tax=Diorhabda sublineata TaxID=1163346 RepID=UPI0024E0A1F1|nr:zinc finger protein ZFP2-like [Diorhabda sublineata]